MGMMVLFMMATLVQVLFWGGLFWRLARVREVGAASQPSLSVAICARDEARNLAERLPLVLEQNYPNFEVIVIDHASADDTPAVLERLAARYPHLRVLRCDDPRPGKRAALSMGILAARNEWVVLTDADCRPAGADWLSSLAARMDKGAEVLLGYGPLERRPGFLNAFARYETAMTAIQYFSYARAGMPYMGVGRNLAYRKATLRPETLDAHRDLMAGDDDLLVGALAKGENTRIAIGRESYAWSAAAASWRDFFRQKSRHLSVSRRYKPGIQLLLGAWALSFIGHYGLGILACWGGSWALVLSAYVLRQALIAAVFGKWSKQLEISDLRWMSPLLDFALFLYYLLMAPAVWLPHRKKWR